jgi:hypothetical protein
VRFLCQEAGFGAFRGAQALSLTLLLRSVAIAPSPGECVRLRTWLQAKKFRTQSLPHVRDPTAEKSMGQTFLPTSCSASPAKNPSESGTARSVPMNQPGASAYLGNLPAEEQMPSRISLSIS